MWNNVAQKCLMFVKFIYLTIHPFISFSLHMNNETEFHCCTSLVRQASLLSWHQDQVVQRADPPCSRERSHPPAGSVHGQWQDQDDTRAKQNHPAQAEEQRRELAQSNWLFAHTHTHLVNVATPVKLSVQIQFTMKLVANFALKFDYAQEERKAVFFLCPV